MAASAGARAAGVVFAAAAAFGFSFKAIFVKAAYLHGVDAETLLALRMGYALPFFMLMAIAAGGTSALRRRDWAELLLLGVLGYYLSSYLDFLGLRYISAALERIILFIYPTLVVLLSALLLHKPLSGERAALLLACYLGVALSVAPALRAAGAHTLLGGVLVFASALSYAVYLMLSGETVARLGSMRVTAYATGGACILCVAQFVLLRPLSALQQPWQVQVLALCMAVFSTVVPIWLVTEAIRRLGAGTASMIGSLGPIITIGLASALLGERLGWAQVVGALIVVVAVTWLSRSRAVI